MHLVPYTPILYTPILATQAPALTPVPTPAPTPAPTRAPLSPSQRKVQVAPQPTPGPMPKGLIMPVLHKASPPLAGPLPQLTTTTTSTTPMQSTTGTRPLAKGPGGTPAPAAASPNVAAAPAVITVVVHSSDDDGTDCYDKLASWWVDWNEEKLKYCCNEKRISCPVRPFDCKQDLANALTWNASTTKYCCDQEQLGCRQETTTTPAPDPDCDITPTNQYAAWEDVDKEWCCAEKNVACQDFLEPIPGVTAQPASPPASPMWQQVLQQMPPDVVPISALMSAEPPQGHYVASEPPHGYFVAAEPPQGLHVAAEPPHGPFVAAEQPHGQFVAQSDHFFQQNERHDAPVAIITRPMTLVAGALCAVSTAAMAIGAVVLVSRRAVGEVGRPQSYTNGQDLLEEGDKQASDDGESHL